MIQQQPCERCVLIEPAHKSLRHHASEQRRVTAKALFVDLCLRVHIGAMLNEPAGNFDLVEIDADVEKGGSVQRCSVQCEGMICMATQRRRIYLFVRESPVQQASI